MIQVSLKLWPKHCTSVGGPIKVLHSSLWELQPPVKDSSLEQNILKSGLALPSVDSLSFFLSLFLRRLLQESMSVHLSIKMHHGKAKTTPIRCWSTPQEPCGTHGCASEHHCECSAALQLLDFNRHCGNCVVIQRQAGKQVQRQESDIIASLSQDSMQVMDLGEGARRDSSTMETAKG